MAYGTVQKGNNKITSRIMKSQRIIIFIAMFLSCAGIHAQDFDRYFCDSTLRIDYIFSGNVSRQTIAVDELNRIPRWYGKRLRLATLPLEGNGQITVM